MPTMSPEERDRIRDAAERTTHPPRPEMPTWRRDVETMVMPPQVRANYGGIARRAYAAEHLRRRQMELPFEPPP